MSEEGGVVTFSNPEFNTEMVHVESPLETKIQDMDMSSPNLEEKHHL